MAAKHVAELVGTVTVGLNGRIPKGREHELCEDALTGRVCRDAADAEDLRARLAALPGSGEMNIKALGAVLAKRFGVAEASELVPWHPTLGDVDSPQALFD